MASEPCIDKETLGPWYQRYRRGAQEDANDLLPGYVTQSRAPVQSRKRMDRVLRDRGLQTPSGSLPRIQRTYRRAH